MKPRLNAVKGKRSILTPHVSGWTPVQGIWGKRISSDGVRVLHFHHGITYKQVICPPDLLEGQGDER